MHILQAGLYTFGKFVQQIRASQVTNHFPDFMTFMSDHFRYSHGVNI